MAALGVTGITRVSNSVSHLHIKNRTLKLSNTNLLSYNTVRKQAIQEGLILPSTVGSGDWDGLLLLLFENAAEIETPTTGRGDPLGQFIHSRTLIGNDYEVPAKDFLAAYQKWYIEEGHPERWKPTRNATYDQLRSKGYRIPDNRTTSGTTKIFGLDLKVI